MDTEQAELVVPHKTTMLMQIPVIREREASITAQTVHACLHGWLYLIHLIITFRAILVRIIFILFTIVSIRQVVLVKEDSTFILLGLLVIPMLAELFYAINKLAFKKSTERSTLSKCACPSIWILELSSDESQENAIASAYVKYEYWADKSSKRNKNEHFIIMGTTIEEYLKENHSDDHEHEAFSIFNGKSLLNLLEPGSSYLNVRSLEQFLLLSLIVGRWLLPREGMSRDQLSQLLLINFGTAADILEVFEGFGEKYVTDNKILKLVLMCAWQASLLQFCFNKAATVNRRNLHRYHDTEEGISSAVNSSCRLLLETELWAIGLVLMLQDVPFLVLRLAFILRYNVRTYTNIFFTCKNVLVILLQVYRSFVIICYEVRGKEVTKSVIVDLA